jgi:hypothetical protein
VISYPYLSGYKEEAMNKMKTIRLIMAATGLCAAATVFAAGSKEPTGAKMAKPPEGAMMAASKAGGTDMTAPPGR